jgi:hypothetical protein
VGLAVVVEVPQRAGFEEPDPFEEDLLVVAALDGRGHAIEPLLEEGDAEEGALHPLAGRLPDRGDDACYYLD